MVMPKTGALPPGEDGAGRAKQVEPVGQVAEIGRGRPGILGRVGGLGSRRLPALAGAPARLRPERARPLRAAGSFDRPNWMKARYPGGPRARRGK